ncbi:MAG: DUF1924 domain-containing protein [Hydrogenophaga sp.]|nr:DUF1924 domain-containing protein [Hydrogenophaga sp.]
MQSVVLPLSAGQAKPACRTKVVSCAWATALCPALSGAAVAADTSATEQLQRWTVEAKAPGNADKGKVFFNAKAFTEVAKLDKWFRRNCKDVLSRECTAAEKADVMAYLTQLK